MKLKLRQILKLQAGLIALDGQIKLSEVNGKPVPVQIPYEFTGSLRWNIRKNLRIVSGRVEDIEKVRVELSRQHSGRPDGFDPADKSREAAAKFLAFDKEYTALLDSEEEFAGLLKLTQEQLNLDKNPLPGTVLEALDPLIAE